MTRRWSRHRRRQSPPQPVQPSDRIAAANARPVRLPEPGQLVRDRWLTRRWTGCTARLWTPIPAWLVDHDGRQVLVDDAPAGSCIHIDQVWRVGPLIADLRVLGSPAVTPQLWLVAPWPAVDVYPRTLALAAAA